MKNLLSEIALLVFPTVILFSVNGYAQAPDYGTGIYLDDPAFNYIGDELVSEVLDVNGSIYSVGRSTSITDSLPSCGGQPYFRFGTNGDAFLSKHSVACNGQLALEWIRYIGNPAGPDFAYSLASDVDDGQTYIYITGEIKTNSQNPDAPLAFSCNGNCSGTTPFQAKISNNRWDGFIAKYDVSGTLIGWTYFGGNGKDQPLGIIIDPVTHDVFITGYTESNNLHKNAVNYFDNTVNSTGDTNGDCFVAQFDKCLTQLKFFSYVGGAASDRGHSIALTASESQTYLIVGGTTGSENIAHPVPGAYDTEKNSLDAFLLRWNIANMVGQGIPETSYDWLTYFGGDEAERARGVTIADDGSIYLSGQTASWPSGPGSTFQPTDNAFQSTNNSVGNDTWDAFVTKFSLSGDLVWFTYFGGNKNDYVKHIARYYDPLWEQGAEGVVITGLTSSSTGIVPDGSAYLNNEINGTGLTGKRDAFATVIKTTMDAGVVTSQSIPFSSYLGGKNDEFDGPGNDQLSYGPTVADGGPNTFHILTSTKSKDVAKASNLDLASGSYHFSDPKNYDGYLMRITVTPTCKLNEVNTLSGKVIAYPNPFDQHFYIDIDAADAGDGIISVYNMSGQLILTRHEFLTGGKNQLTIDLSRHPAGVYLCRVSENDRYTELRLIKE